ncbi:MAG: XisI protein [Cyanobacteria bacterium SBLK]|nr:XisI protein [Cyanobacteria bacterium SBLK]
MESGSQYADILEETIRDYHDWADRAADDTFENCLICDRDRGYFLWYQVGWNGDRRISRTMIFARLKNGKIWIEEDWTTEGIATDLMVAGVPNYDIVLGFHPPYKREFTEFATA